MQPLTPISSNLPDFSSGLARIQLRYPGLDLTRCKLVGWGAGNQFERLYPRVNLPIDYTVCIWDGNIGKTKHGVHVYPVDKLLKENPDEVIVLVFSNMWFECMRQIAQLGTFRSMRAVSEYSGENGTLNALKAFHAPRAAHAPHGDLSIGIMMQGAIQPDITPRVLEANRRAFPFATVVLSTWSETPADLLAACAPHADEIVTSPRPWHPGAYNILMQRDSTLAGLAALRRRNVDFSFKTRTDHAILGQYDFAPLLEVMREPVSGANRGSVSRIGFCPLPSWRFIPFHLTDQLQFGRTADLQVFWNAPDDHIMGSSRHTESDPARFLAMVTSEAHLTRSFLQRTGVPYDLSLRSYWEVTGDRFAAIPESEFYPFSWKALPVVDLEIEPRSVSAELDKKTHTYNLMNAWSFNTWRSLTNDPARMAQLANAVDKLGLTVRDLHCATPFQLDAT